MKRSDLSISSPCTANWDTMTRVGRKRFCSDCSKHVHDLSAMTAAQAKALVEQPENQELCVRYAYDKLGNVLFATPAAQPLIALQALLPSFRLAAAAVATTAAIAAYSASQQPKCSEGSGSVAMGTLIAAPIANDPPVQFSVPPPQELEVAAPRVRMGALKYTPPPAQEVAPQPKHRK